MNFSVIRNANTDLGNAIAITLADLGRHLILLGSDLISLEKMAENLRTSRKVKVFSISADDSSMHSILKACEIINNDFQVDLFINYSEINFYGKFSDQAVQTLDFNLKRNFLTGPIYTHQLLPNLMLHANAYVLNLYSSYNSKPSQWTTILNEQNINFSNYLGEDVEDSGVIVKACTIEINDIRSNTGDCGEHLKIAQALLDSLFHNQAMAPAL